MKKILGIILLIALSTFVLTQSGSLSKVQDQGGNTALFETKGYIYPYGSDTYYYLRSARNILEHGHVGEYLQEGVPFSKFSLAPSAQAVNPGWYPWILAGLGYFIGLLGSAFWLPVIFGVCSVLFVFLIGYELFGYWKGFYAGLIFSMHPFFVTWNYAGFADTNAISLLLSLLFIYFIVLARRNKAWLLGALVTYIVYSQIWTGAFYILIISAIMAGVYLLLKKENTYLAGTLGLVIISLFIKYWPVVRTRLLADAMVTELQRLSLTDLYIGFGGLLGIIITLSAIIFLLQYNRPEYGMIIAWFIPLFVVGVLSKRFIFYAAPPLCLMIGVGYTESVHWIKKQVPYSMVLIMLSIILIPFIYWDSVNYLEQLHPPMNDEAIGLLEKIYHASGPDAIIASMWDKGYLYQYYGHLGTLVDPANHDHPRVNLLAKVWTSRNTTRAAETIHNMVCTTQDCPDIYAVLDANMVYQLAGMGNRIGEKIKVGGIHRCQGMQCGNIDLSKGTLQGQKAKHLIQYGENTIIQDAGGQSFSIVSYNAGGRYAFVIDDPYSQSLLVRLIARDTVEGFELMDTIDSPEQMVVYKVNPLE